MLSLFSFPNDYLSFDVSFSKGDIREVSFTKNNFTETKLNLFMICSQRQKDEFKLTSGNPSGIFTKFRFYIDKEGSDISNECVLFEI